MMNQDGTFLDGELTQELGYVSTLAQFQLCHHTLAASAFFKLYLN